jgi:hypothetical protein
MGMTFDQYLAYLGTPENLQREAGWLLGPQRMDSAPSCASATRGSG